MTEDREQDIYTRARRHVETCTCSATNHIRIKDCEMLDLIEAKRVAERALKISHSNSSDAYFSEETGWCTSKCMAGVLLRAEGKIR